MVLALDFEGTRAFIAETGANSLFGTCSTPSSLPVLPILWRRVFLPIRTAKVLTIAVAMFQDGEIVTPRSVVYIRNSSKALIIPDFLVLLAHHSRGISHYTEKAMSGHSQEKDQHPNNDDASAKSSSRLSLTTQASSQTEDTPPKHEHSGAGHAESALPGDRDAEALAQMEEDWGCDPQNARNWPAAQKWLAVSIVSTLHAVDLCVVYSLAPC